MVTTRTLKDIEGHRWSEWGLACRESNNVLQRLAREGIPKPENRTRESLDMSPITKSDAWHFDVRACCFRAFRCHPFDGSCSRAVAQIMSPLAKWHRSKEGLTEHCLPQHAPAGLSVSLSQPLRLYSLVVTDISVNFISDMQLAA